MTDDEKQQNDVEETPQDEAPQDEASEAAGPVAGEDPSSSPGAASEEEPTPAPPAEEEAAPAKPEPSPEDELPWKERERLRRSRRPHEARPETGPEERKAERREARKRKAEVRRKARARAKATKGPARAGTPPAAREANAPKVRQGIVVSDRAQKSITVRIDVVRRHPTYEKVVRSSRTLHAHDERDEANEGDVVRVVETRPLSKTKRWRLSEILEKAR